MKKLFVFLPFCFLANISSAKTDQPCRTAPGYQFRYTQQDKNNPANNIIWLEDNKGFRIVPLQGADCSKLAISGEAVYWLEYPGHVINSFNLTTRFYSSYSEGGQFLISPDGQRMVIERDETLSMVNLNTKNETTFFPLPERATGAGENKVTFIGWTNDSSSLWFALSGADKRPRDFYVLTHQGDLISTNMRTDPLLEAVFFLNEGWITQNNGTELAVFDLLSERKILVDTCSVGEKFKPHWTSSGHLKYTKGGKEFTILVGDVRTRLEKSGLPSSTIVKRSFEPVSW